jgi:DNA-binding NtrC family response regulator
MPMRAMETEAESGDKQRMIVKKLSIAVVDESKMIQKIMKDFLGDLGHAVQTFGSVPELCAETGIIGLDLIFLYPDTTREQSLKMISQTHELYPKTDIVVMRNPIELPVLENEAQDKVYAYLHKPFRLTDLELMVTRIAEKRESLEL